ncbi:MAG: hypothetical protein EBU59_09985, partial [Planctomycetia bacterium]|nr:hypothetical protein [Planctomycetia bacterium]
KQWAKALMVEAGIPTAGYWKANSREEALHALDAAAVEWRGHRDLILDFIDSLWSAEGGFHGSWADDDLDSEYTFYGLLALGHAST